MFRQLALSLLLLSLSPLALAQSDLDCRAIATATVAELRAGYENWNDEAEQLARAAAGAACVKASTGIAVQPAPAAARGLTSTAVRPAGAVEETPVASTSDTSTETAAVEEESVEEEKKEESWNPFADLKFNKVSARPGKKPYERRREADLDDE